jgi:Multiubiquitin
MSKDEAPGQTKEVKIFVNTIEKIVNGPTISYEDVVKLAYPKENFKYSVSYSGGKGGKEGALLPGKKLPLEEEMIFDVTPTDKS